MKKIVIEDVTEFSLKQIAESGQTFRWKENENGSYTIIAFARVINAVQEGSKIIITGASKEDFSLIWKDYFDLNRNYKEIIESFRGKDGNLDKAIVYGEGVRILNQELWEIIITFIISGNNNIPRIKKSIERISEKYGTLIDEIEGKKYYAFPRPSQLNKATVEDLRECGVGYRDAYIYHTTKAIVNEEIDLNKIRNINLDEARKELKRLKGVGDKVADCILLFACNQTNAFPIDTWVKKILTKYYGLAKTGNKEVNIFAREYFGDHCGIAQQYLFYYIRNNNE
ncbi:MAG: 8-oxoguanine DNA glycosylase [Alkaliphilus sp.]|nr:MAG: 8-oxoguanine DNA glycosylase [Alkaliphilus sp.]